MPLVPEPTARSAVPGVSPGRGLLTVHRRSLKWGRQGRVGITSSFLRLQSSEKNITKTMQTIKNSEEKDEYELDKYEVSKPSFFLSFRQSKYIVL